MSRTIIVSNRLPITIKVDDDNIEMQPSVGGLATGLQSIYKSNGGVWIGWPGIDANEISADTQKAVDAKLLEHSCKPVYIDEQDIDQYYFGFSNRTIWPLFHYFTEYTEYQKNFWKSYVKVNEQFADVVINELEPGDTVWVHDYHLLLLPQMIREKRPDVSIGFFLHIPFPSYEVFRILPWRNEIIEGLLGADLIGFHTYDYERHFMSCVRRLLGHEINFNQIVLNERVIKVDNFPMGIDYDKFYNASLKLSHTAIQDRSKMGQDIGKYFLSAPGRKLIVSIDRMDYTKGIPNRISAFELFLEKHPEFREKVSLIMVATPSRSDVEQYQNLKSEVDEMVGRINGRFATIDWTPIWYFYRSLPVESLIEMYSASDIALITPVRDGMNLVAKEYLASKIDKKGVLIISEMAGASKEMSEALIINPNNYEEISKAIHTALCMSDEEQIERNEVLQNRLKRYNIDKWCNDFMYSLEKTKKIKASYNARRINERIAKNIKDNYEKAEKRILFLDYDGTLVGFHTNPQSAKPDEELYGLLDQLAANPKNELVLISGRDNQTFDKWFKGKNYTMITEHGVWLKTPGDSWEFTENINNDWKEIIRPSIEFYVDRTPGSFIEEKNFSLVWHYRKTDPELGAIRALELKDELTSLVSNHNLEIMEGNKVIEIKTSGINKGHAALKYIGNREFDFILGVGDDWTDEYLFRELPEEAVTIKVGMRNTQARYNIDKVRDVRNLLKMLAEE